MRGWGKAGESVREPAGMVGEDCERMRESWRKGSGGWGKGGGKAWGEFGRVGKGGRRLGRD